MNYENYFFSKFKYMVLIGIVCLIWQSAISQEKKKPEKIVVNDTIIVNENLIVRAVASQRDLVATFRDELNLMTVNEDSIYSFKQIQEFINRNQESLQKLINDMTMIIVKDSLILEKEYATIDKKIKKIEQSTKTHGIEGLPEYQELIKQREKIYKQMSEIEKKKK